MFMHACPVPLGPLMGRPYPRALPPLVALKGEPQDRLKLWDQRAHPFICAFKATNEKLPYIYMYMYIYIYIYIYTS